MSRVVYVVNDDLKEYIDVGQGYSGFWLWTAETENDQYTDPLNYFANRAFSTDSSIRFVDEHWLYETDEGDVVFRHYNKPSLKEMQEWLHEKYPRYYKPSEDK